MIGIFEIESVRLSKGTGGKKLKATINLKDGGTKTVSFGASGYNDFTIYSKIDKKLAEDKKKNYIARHSVNEDWTDASTSGFWSRYILWNQPTVEKSMDWMENKYGFKFL
jgi:hypothetical protein